MTNNRTLDEILDVSDAKTLDEVVDIQTNYKILNNSFPKRLLFDSKVQAREMFNFVIYLNLRPWFLFGIRVIFKQDIKEWQEYRKSAPSFEFWIKYWTTDLEELGFDPLEGILING